MLSRLMFDRLPQAEIKNNILVTIYTGFFRIISNIHFCEDFLDMGVDNGYEWV
jgi:hypothetical protein